MCFYRLFLKQFCNLAMLHSTLWILNLLALNLFIRASKTRLAFFMLCLFTWVFLRRDQNCNLLVFCLAQILFLNLNFHQQRRWKFIILFLAKFCQFLKKGTSKKQITWLQYTPKYPQTWIKTMASVNLSDHGPSLKLDPHVPENFSQIKLFLNLVWKYTINFFVWGLKIYEF